MPWEPQPHEADLFNEVYIDESTTTKHRYMVIGGIVVPMKYAAQLEADIIQARGTDLPITQPNGEPRVIKWEKVWIARLDAYTRAVDAFFDFPKKHFPTSSLPFLDFHCTAVDTSKKDDRKFSDGDRDIGFSKEIYFLCVERIAERYVNGLFHIYPDRRNTKTPLEISMGIMNMGLRKRGDQRLTPIRRFQFEDPERKQALQLADILMGAVAYRLNHYNTAHPDAPKKRLCDYILKRAKIKRIMDNTRHTGRFTLFHRNFSPYPKER